MARAYQKINKFSQVVEEERWFGYALSEILSSDEYTDRTVKELHKLGYLEHASLEEFLDTIFSNKELIIEEYFGVDWVLVEVDENGDVIRND